MTSIDKGGFPHTSSIDTSAAAVTRYRPAGSSGAYYAYTLGREVQDHHQQLFSQYAYEASRDNRTSVPYAASNAA
jgi:hypothetical protein